VAWIIIAFFSILKGGEGGSGIVDCGTLAYWGLVLAPVPLIVGMVWKMGNDLADMHEEKERLGFEFVEGDLLWTRRNVRIYPLYTITAGFAAGALGIAAGTILGPILLEMGMVPLVGTASSGFMVIFTASSTSFQFLIMGQLQIDYAGFFCCIGTPPSLAFHSIRCVCAHVRHVRAHGSYSRVCALGVCLRGHGCVDWLPSSLPSLPSLRCLLCDCTWPAPCLGPLSLASSLSCLLRPLFSCILFGLRSALRR
jgi:hypothetical protein